MNLDNCVSEIDYELPDPIVDLSTLSLSIDNQGIATMSIVLWTQTTNNITGRCEIDVGGGILKGYIVSDSPQEVEGTEYYSHSITVLGMIEAEGGGGSAPVVD